MQLYYQIFNVLNIYINCLLHLSVLELINSVCFLVQSVNFIEAFIQLLTMDISGSSAVEY